MRFLNNFVNVKGTISWDYLFATDGIENIADYRIRVASYICSHYRNRFNIPSTVNITSENLEGYWITSNSKKVEFRSFWEKLLQLVDSDEDTKTNVLLKRQMFEGNHFADELLCPISAAESVIAFQTNNALSEENPPSERDVLDQVSSYETDHASPDPVDSFAGKRVSVDDDGKVGGLVGRRDAEWCMEFVENFYNDGRNLSINNYCQLNAAMKGRDKGVREDLKNKKRKMSGIETTASTSSKNQRRESLTVPPKKRRVEEETRVGSQSSSDNPESVGSLVPPTRNEEKESQETSEQLSTEKTPESSDKTEDIDEEEECNEERDETRDSSVTRRAPTTGRLREEPDPPIDDEKSVSPRSRRSSDDEPEAPSDGDEKSVSPRSRRLSEASSDDESEESSDDESVSSRSRRSSEASSDDESVSSRSRRSSNDESEASSDDESVSPRGGQSPKASSDEVRPSPTQSIENGIDWCSGHSSADEKE